MIRFFHCEDGADERGEVIGWDKSGLVQKLVRCFPNFLVAGDRCVSLIAT
ncbi:Hypothetical protein, putative [Bodo saltans]|uniref:Uncharacterized protein n=1 Tax=Bodo saltans TaxID=75058 RepID=A0A0S4J9H4_BODSA|nr:Hypothetical protein, putative [Bodo saltans]|eukprot:CUG87127.1 Hypothetical protein, putative [Bodo saltans]